MFTNYEVDNNKFTVESPGQYYFIQELRLTSQL